jgi:exodeoxyribonuclease V beta subunit
LHAGKKEKRVRTIEYLRPSILDGIAPDGHAIIEASAGTGKTYAIEHLVIELLRGAAKSIEEILIVTFTDKATTELRGRIRALIERLLVAESPVANPQQHGHAAASIDGAAWLRLEQALAAFERAPVFTIHAFCHRVLTEFAFQSGARFTLELDDGRRAFRAAFRAQLREEFAVDRLMRRALAQWLEEKSADHLEKLLYEAHRCHYEAADRTRTIAAAAHALATNGTIEPRLLTELYLPPVEERLDRDKRRYGQIDYDDMLAWVWRALEGPGGAALTAALRQRYRFALVDEFQDTDDLQWRIFNRVFVQGGDGNRLFVVGDAKQAIYAFRNADVHSYLRAREQLIAAGGAVISIDRNFRSTANLIDACNIIFDQQAEAPLFDGAIAYERAAMCGVPERLALDARGRPIVPITLMRYDSPAGEKGSAEDTREQLGRFIAATIKRMLEDPADAIAIEEPGRDSAEAARRRVAARDIFVLASTNEDCRKIGGYLGEAGVPFAFYKLDGLFQSDEAQDVLDVLRALEDLNDRSRRRRAWMTPFFSLNYREIATINDLPASHPLDRLLFEWRALAEAERFAELFDRLMHESGLTDRQLFLNRSERELTNYFHIFEVLLERVVAGRLSLAEIIELLSDYVSERAQPAGPDGNIQRIESEHAAVQVMTVHMSKGLEADVVMLFGGLFGNNQLPPVAIYHEGHDRRFAIGKEAQDEKKTSIKRERREEEQRLTYVALTRARAKLYLPLYPDGSTNKPTGYYAQLNRRLKDAIATRGGPTDGARWAELFEICEARGASGSRTTKRETIPIEQWLPAAELLENRSEPGIVFERLRNERAAFRMSSYTSLTNDTGAWDLTPEDFKTDLVPATESEDLPGGSSAGLFLHEVIERLDFATLTVAGNLSVWRRLEPVERLFRETMRRHRVRDPRWFDRGTEMVFRTLTSPITIAGGQTIGALADCRNTREMEFLFPIPEASHPRLGATAAAEGWIAERGYLKGFIDFVFENKGLIYFADWKSDLLRDYRAETIGQHVERNYELQALIYSVGVIRLLRIRSEADYVKRFGGLLYVFLRGVGADADRTHGIHFQRPDWNEMRRHENELMKLAGPS